MHASALTVEQQLADVVATGDAEAIEAFVLASLFELFIADPRGLIAAIALLPAAALRRSPQLEVMTGFYGRAALADGSINREVTPALRAEVTAADAEGGRPIHELASIAMLHVGLAELLDGDLEQSLRDFEEARILREPGKPDVVGRDALVKAALVQAARGNLHRAEAALRRAERIPSPSASFQHFTEATATMARALIAVERLDPDADRLVAASLEHGEADELWAFAFLAASKQAAANGDHTRTLDLIHEVSLHKPMPDGSFAAIATAAAHARALLLLGETETAAEILERCRDEGGKRGATIPDRVRLALLAEGPAAALELGRRFAVLTGLGPAARAETMLLMAWAQQQAQGEPSRATTQPLGRLIAREGLWRTLLLVPGEVAASIPGLEHAPEAVREHRMRAARGDGEERITAAELEILRLLAGSDSLPAIARARFVTPNTVKSQVASLYRRLGVHQRRDAVAEARRRRLLD